MYLSLARKYRPKDFNEVVGQEHIVLTLKNAIKLNRINQAYLFYGPRGTGKTSIARILAKSLNCKEGPSEICCCKCLSCLEIDESRSLDVIEIDGASNRGIEQIRELRDSVGYRAIGGRYRAYIIDEVHMLTIEAFNALLKTLEEPPAYVIFIFATTEVQKVPKTISSRTQMFEFLKIEKDLIQKDLLTIAKIEDFKIDKDVISLISSFSDGSLRDAISILDQVVLYKESPSCDDLRRILGLCNEKTIISLIEVIKNKDKSSIQFIKGLIDDGFFPDMIIKGILNVLKNLIVEAEEKNLPLEWLVKLADVFVETQERIRRLPDDSELILEMALIKLIQETEVKREDVNVSLEPSWSDILEIIGREKPLLKTPLKEAEVEIEPDKIILFFKIHTHKRIIEKEENREAIEKILEEKFKRKIRIFTEIKEIPNKPDIYDVAQDIFKARKVR